MGQIASVMIDGFWDNHHLTLNVFPDTTFIIGQNGTGKTTLINLIAAVLTVDIRTLYRTSFKRIVITLSSAEGVGPQISAQKIRRKDRREEIVEYKIRTGTDTDANKDWRLPLDEGEEFGRTRQMLLYYGSGRTARHGVVDELSKELKALVQVNWLSVHRAPSIVRNRDERPFESAVDQRLEDLSNELVRYLSTLSQQREDEIRQFQESIFISLVEQQQEASLFETSELNNIDQTVSTLGGVFDELHVNPDVAKSLLNAFLDRGREIDQRLGKRSKKQDPFKLDDAVYLLGLKRVGNVVKRWNELQKKSSHIFSPRERYLATVNGLLQRKTMEITASNEWKFMSRSGKQLKTELLSSGEKQLLILLTETLLQREAPAVFIADEPELSLHVLWQEKIVSSLRYINPNAQIIAATHSPDIVGVRSDCVIDMEQLIP